MKKHSGLFDVTMGAYDREEVWELVSTHILSLISKKYNKKDFRLSRDDGLGVVRKKKCTRNRKNKEKHTKNI